MKRLFAIAGDILIPRFVTDDWAADVYDCRECDDPHVHPVCMMRDVEPGEEFDGIVTCRSFNLFGIGLFPRWSTDWRPWVNPHDGVAS